MSDRAPLFSSEDQEANHYLGVLRDGNPQDQILARDRLSHIFERRGMVQQAVELLESNARAGVTEPRLYMTLSSHYRALGRAADADAAMAHAASLMNRQQSVAPAVQPSISPMPYQQPGYPQQPPQQQWAQPYGQQPVIHVAPQMTNVIHNNVVVRGGANHPPFIIRLIYFLFIGWWFGFTWIGMAILLFLPTAFFMKVDGLG